VNHRHLLPDEIELLLDDEVGFGVAPLKAHLEECRDCRADVEEARRFAQALEDAPHFSPTHTFADRVMRDVVVFVPWHVAARDFVRGLVPKSRKARIGALALGGGAATITTAALLWILTQTDVLVFVTGLAGDRVRQALVTAAGQVVVTVFGEQALALFMQTGVAGLAVVLLGFVGATIGALVSLRGLTVVASRRRG
jgi:hypothetical protein